MQLGYIAYEASPTMALKSSRVKVLSALTSARRYGFRRGMAGPAYRTALDRLEALQGRVREIGTQVSTLPEHLQADVNERIQSLVAISNQTVQYISRGMQAQAQETMSHLETELASFEGYLASLDPDDVIAPRRQYQTGASAPSRVLSTTVPQEGSGGSSVPWFWILGGVAAVGGLLLWLELK